jgi:hypothetical protein
MTNEDVVEVSYVDWRAELMLPGLWDLSICFYTNDPAFVVKHEAYYLLRV